MLFTRCTKLNGELIRNLPPTMKEELINFEGVIPDGIMASLYVNDSFYKKERHNFLNRRPDLLEKMYCARGKREELSQLMIGVMLKLMKRLSLLEIILSLSSLLNQSFLWMKIVILLRLFLLMSI